MLLAVRSSHGALLEQAAAAFFDAAQLPTARYPSQPLPAHLRVSRTGSGTNAGPLLRS